MKSILFVFLLSFYVHAEKSRHECLIKLLNILIEGNEKSNLLPTNLYSIHNSMIMSGISEVDANIFVRELNQFLKAPNPSPIAKDLKKFMRTHLDDDKRLVICMLNKDCHIPQGYGVTKSFKTIYAIADKRFMPSSEMNIVNEKEIPSELISGITNQDYSRHFSASMFNFHEVKDKKEWPAVFVHEMAHAEFLDFLNRWIDANNYIVSKNGNPDSLFEDYITKGDDGRIYIEKQFFSAMTEIRAYLAELLIRGESQSGRDVVINNLIKELDVISPEFKEAHKMNNLNAILVSKNLLIKMNNTIRRSEKLKNI